jgi:hypothetical protein
MQVVAISGPPPAHIFISYRRDDGGHAGRVYDHLTREFSREAVFYDWENLPLAKPYRAELEKAIRAAHVFLAVIGQHWLSEENRKRLHEPDDVAREEIRIALECTSKKNPYALLPLLAGGATMPKRGDLPDDIEPLADIQAYRLEDRHYDRSMQELIDFLANECGLRRKLGTREGNVVVDLRTADVSPGPTSPEQLDALRQEIARVQRMIEAAAGGSPT